jgi:hypothetical protein
MKANPSEKQQIFSRNLKSKKGMEWGILSTERKKICKPRLLNPEKLPFVVAGVTKTKTW